MARKPHPPFRKITEDERQKMREWYPRMSSYEIGRRLKRSYKVVTNHLKQMGIPIRDNSHCQKRYTLNDTYFQNIDTPEKAYILGFIFADGNLRGNRLKVAIQDRDRPLLEAMLKEFGSNAPIGVEFKKNVKHRDMCVLTAFGREFCSHLRAQGMTQRKDRRLKLPVLNNELMRAFVFGYFDGDGSVISYIAPEGSFRYAVLFAGHDGFIRDLQAYFVRMIGVRGSFNVAEGLGRSLSFNCTKALQVLNHMYQSRISFCLSRKQERFAAIVSSLNENRYRKAPHTVLHVDTALTILQDAA